MRMQDCGAVESKRKLSNCPDSQNEEHHDLVSGRTLSLSNLLDFEMPNRGQRT